VKILEEVELRPDFFSVISTLVDNRDPIAQKIQDIFFDQEEDKSKYDWVDLDSNLNLVNFQLKNTKHSGKVRLGRIVRDILVINNVEFKDSDIEKFVNSYRAILSDTSTTFEVWKGEQILNAYNPENYLKKNTGGLGHSCMNGSNYNELSLYIDNPDSINLLVLKRDGKISGRALLWNIEERNGYDKYMDRVYTIQDHELLLFKKWAVDNHYFSWDVSNEAPEEPVRAKLNNWKFEEYPYLDTFCMVDEEGNLQNFFKEGWIKVYNITRGGLDFFSVEVVKDPNIGDKDYYWNNYNQSLIYHDKFTNESYIDVDCVSQNIKLFGYEVMIKTHKNNFQQLERVVSKLDLDDKLSIYILPYLNKYLSRKGLRVIKELGWGRYGYKYDVKREPGEMIIKVYYGSPENRIMSESYTNFGEIYIYKSFGKITVELKIISPKRSKRVTAANMDDLFNNKLNELFGDPKIDVPVKSTSKILKFKNFMNKLLHKIN